MSSVYLPIEILIRYIILPLICSQSFGDVYPETKHIIAIFTITASAAEIKPIFRIVASGAGVSFLPRYITYIFKVRVGPFTEFVYVVRYR